MVGCVSLNGDRETMSYTHRNQNQTVRDNQLVGNIRVSSTRYNTGREDVTVYDLIPTDAKQATQLGF